MSKRAFAIIVAVITVLAFYTPAANASLSQDTVIKPGADPIFQQWAYEALVDTPDAMLPSWGSVNAHWEGPLPNARCGSWAGCAWMWPPEIILDPADAGRSHFWHELGHLYDWWDMTSNERTKFLGYVSSSTWTLQIQETFAEAYKRCAGFAQPSSNFTGITDAELRETCQFLRN